jgi:hypothetical protein
VKKNFSSSLLAAAILALALASGCDTPEGRHPKTTQVVALLPNQVTPDVILGLVSAIQVVLPGPAEGSGLVWEIASNDNRILEQLSPVKTNPGAQPTTSVSFYALKPGKSVMRFFLVHPSEQVAVPVAKCEVTVRVRE